MSRCATPLRWEQMVDWLTGDLAEEEAAVVEEHLFACPDCAAALEETRAFVEAVAGLIPPVVSAERVRSWRASGVRLVETPVAPGAAADVIFGPKLDLAIHVLRADLEGAERVDVELLADPSPAPVTTLEGVPFDPHGGALYIACQRHYRRLGFPDDLRFRVIAVRGEERRVVGEYLVRHHFPTSP